MAIAERIPTYRPPIPNSLRQRYENGLSGVQRWQRQPLPTLEPENDLQHVKRGEVIIDDMQERLPAVRKEVDFEIVRHMFYIHDAGEIIVGDLARQDFDWDKLKPRHKRREKAAFRLMTREIQDIELQAYARQLYKRAEDKNSNDKEAQLTDVIDKVQAVRFGLVNVFHGNLIGKAKDLRTQDGRKQQLNTSITILLTPLFSFYNTLEIPQARKEFKQFAIEEVDRFIAHGYTKREVEPYLELLYHLTPQPVASKL